MPLLFFPFSVSLVYSGRSHAEGMSPHACGGEELHQPEFEPPFFTVRDFILTVLGKLSQCSIGRFTLTPIGFVLKLPGKFL